MVARMKTAHLNIAIIIALGVIAALGTSYYDSLRPQSSYEITPNFSITDINGAAHELENFRGKIVILNFWATWCAPCIKEFPQLLKIAKDHKDKIILFAVSSDVNDELIHAFLAKQQFPKDAANIIVARDTQDITGKLFHTYKIPETFVIDRGGSIRAKFSGAEGQPQQIEPYIE
jgi:cytochrome c biogenesis protein CcmG, thiol:disulfide interchange protein DsbE